MYGKVETDSIILLISMIVFTCPPDFPQVEFIITKSKAENLACVLLDRMPPNDPPANDYVTMSGYYDVRSSMATTSLPSPSPSAEIS